MKQNIFLFIFIGIFVLLSACVGITPKATATATQSPSKEIQLWVGPKQVDCQGGPQGKCLQAK
jgi:hypothetical protein